MVEWGIQGCFDEVGEDIVSGGIGVVWMFVVVVWDLVKQVVEGIEVVVGEGQQFVFVVDFEFLCFEGSVDFVVYGLGYCVVYVEWQ